MSSVIKVNASVYSRIGYGRAHNTSSFYMNGKFTSENHIENVQASMENRGAEYLFAVADNMICEEPEQDTNVSILKEIGRFHEKITVNGGDIKQKTKELESRVNDTERLLSSILEMNRVPMHDTRWNLGFSGLLMSEGQFVALTGGSGRVYMMRDGMFRPLASETTKAKRAIDAKVQEEEDNEDNVELSSEEETTGSVIVSDIYDLQEGDAFILLSDGLFEALGEDKIEDLLALRSDSTYIAYRLVDEAMKRKSSGDLAALVVQIEKLAEGTAPARKIPPRQPAQQTMKAKVDKLNKAPAVTYKYNKRNSGKYQSVAFITLVVLTVLVLLGFVYLIINSLMNTGKENIPGPKTTVTATATPTDSIEPSEE
ncbi:MAG: serine/threonine protein phosphatase, partial [Clostridia bacterium]|nr:serine/threonine protein phosphatase [Clostridia bacterium]